MKGLLLLLGGGTFALAILVGIAFTVGALLWPYSINSWLIYSGRPPVIEWWMGGLMGLVPGLGQSCIPVAFITFIIIESCSRNR